MSALPGSHYCIDHQGNHSEYDPENCAMCKAQEGWLEAAIAWEVCASIHEKWAKGKDALYSTRHADFVRHAEDARKKVTERKGKP